MADRSLPRRRTLWSSRISIVPEPSPSHELKSAAAALPPGRPSSFTPVTNCGAADWEARRWQALAKTLQNSRCAGGSMQCPRAAHAACATPTRDDAHVCMPRARAAQAPNHRHCGCYVAHITQPAPDHTPRDGPRPASRGAPQSMRHGPSLPCPARTSFAETSPSPLMSQSRKRSITRTAEPLRAARRSFAAPASSSSVMVPGSAPRTRERASNESGGGGARAQSTAAAGLRPGRVPRQEVAYECASAATAPLARSRVPSPSASMSTCTSSLCELTTVRAPSLASSPPRSERR